MSDPSTNPLPLGEIVQGPSAFEQFLENNQKLIAVAAVVVALGIGGFMVYRTIEKDRALSAGAAFVAAEDIADLEKVKLEYASTPSSVTAALSIADKQWASGQQDEAIATLQEIIAKFPKHPATVVAQNALGYRFLSQGKTNEATSAFQAVIDRDETNYLAPAATIALGDIAKKAGEKEKAAELYKSVGKDFADSPFANIAAEREKFLNFQAPAEVEAPPVVTEPPPLLVKPESDLPTSPGTGNPALDSLISPDSTEEPSFPEDPTDLPKLPE